MSDSNHQQPGGNHSRLFFALAIVPFLILSAERDLKQRARLLAWTALGLVAVSTVVLWYNYARFGGVFTIGYDRLGHVSKIKLDGRSGLLNSHLPDGDARRGWEYRSPGRGGVDWENFMRALNAVGYAGPLSVDWHDAGLDRDFGAADAARFAKQLDFPGRPREEPPAFR